MVLTQDNILCIKSQPIHKINLTAQLGVDLNKVLDFDLEVNSATN